MKTRMYKKGLIIGVIFLFIGICIIPMGSSTATGGPPHARYVHRTYFIGKIYNLTGNDSSGYHFQSDNIRMIDYWRVGIGMGGFAYEHFGGSFNYTGFYFRGVLKPNFICGYFYIGEILI